MPYDIAKDFQGCAYAVVKRLPDGTNELAPGGCHPNSDKAGAHLAALEAATNYEGRAAGDWVIVDIDGTLTTSDGSDSPRQSLIDWMTSHDYSYAIVSGRPDSRLAETRSWLERNNVPHSSVSLSDFPQGPNASVAFKKNKAEDLIKSHNVVLAIDNDEGARAAYQSVGIKAVGPTSVRSSDFTYELRHPGHGDQSVHDPHKGGGAAAASFDVPNNPFVDQNTKVAASFPHVGLSDKSQEVASRISGTRKVSELSQGGKTVTDYEGTYTTKDGGDFQLKLKQEVSDDGSLEGKVTLSVDTPLVANGQVGSMVYASVGRFIETDKPTFSRISSIGSSLPREGIATAMMEFARMFSPLPILHSSNTSNEGGAFASATRSSDFNYELRHPGHADQSIHNPHKHAGGGALVARDLAAGMDVKVAGSELPGAFDAMAHGDGGVNLNKLSTTDGVSFAATGVKVSRAEMPQVPGSKKAEFVADLKGRGIGVTKESVDPKSLKPIQSEISGQKSGQMLQSMREGKLLEGDNPLVISKDGFVVDGHHRWAAAVARSYEVPVALPVLRVDLNAADLLGEVTTFAKAQAIPARPFDRAVQWHYELRHPGHADQSAHNPHKGVAAAGGGAFVPGKWEKQAIPTREEHLQNIKNTYAVGTTGRTYTAKEQAVLDANTQKVADLTYASQTQCTTYKNGPVTLRVDNDAKAPLTPEIQARMDAVILETQKRYPGATEYGWTNLTGRESGASGAARLGSRSIDLDSAKVTAFRDVGYGGLEHTIWHETGHAIPMKGFPEPSAGQGRGFQLPSEVEPLIGSYSDIVTGKFPQLNRVTSTGGSWGSVSSVVSNYASKDPLEMHAEIFALFHNPDSGSGKFRLDVINAYGEAAGWTK